MKRSLDTPEVDAEQKAANEKQGQEKVITLDILFRKLEEIEDETAKFNPVTAAVLEGKPTQEVVDEAENILSSMLARAEDTIAHFSNHVLLINNYFHPNAKAAPKEEKKGQVFCQRFNTTVPKGSCDGCQEYAGSNLTRCAHQR